MSQPSEPIAIGMIGAGNFARNLHLPNLARIPECRLHAVCDVKTEVADTAAAHYGAVYACTDYRRVLDDPTINAVVIAVRDDLQARFAVEAMQAGKHVYVEKPLAGTPEACAPVVAAHRASGMRLAVGFNRRYAPIYRRMREIIARDGGPFNVHIRMADDAWRWAMNYPPGYLLTLDIGHHFDLLRWCTGAEIASVYCVSSRPDDDCLAIRMSNGCAATINLSGHGTMDMPKERVEVIGDRGGAHAEDFVELRTFGYPDEPPTTHFAGHSNPDGEFMQKYLYEKLGADALYAVRRMTWELRRRVELDPEDSAPDAEEVRRYVGRMIPNFVRDQGWLDALRAFAVGIQTGESTDHAGAEDALAASLATEAALASQASGEVVRL